MSRVLAAFAAVMGVALAGCSGSPFSMPDWLTSKVVAPAVADLAVRIRTTGRQCAHGTRPDVSNTLLPGGAVGKPVGDICEERLPVTDGSSQRRRAARAFLIREKPAAHLDTQPGGSGAPNRLHHRVSQLRNRDLPRRGRSSPRDHHSHRRGRRNSGMSAA